MANNWLPSRMNKNLSLTKKECYVLISSASMSSISMDKKESSTQHGKGMKNCLSTRNLNVFDKPGIKGAMCLDVGTKFV